MNAQKIRAAVSLLTLAFVAACGAGSFGPSAPRGASPQAIDRNAADAVSDRVADEEAADPVWKHPERHKRKPKTQAGVVRILIPKRVRRRGAHFVSGATLGAEIVAKNNKTGFSVTTVANLAPLSKNCTGSGSSRVCTIDTLVPLGSSVTITVTTYDKSPTGTKFPASAKELGFGSVTQKVVLNVTPSIQVYLGGVIANIGAGPAFGSLPANGSSQTAMLVVDPTDYGNQPITAGNKDPYENPITVALTESGGSGHASLLLNGANAHASATMKYSTDTIAVKYDGGGAAGYLIEIAFSATNAPTQTLEVAPMYLTSSSSMYVGGRLVLEGPQVAAPVVIQEAGSPPGSQSYTSTPNGSCTHVATSATVSNAPSLATFNITGGKSASLSGCQIVFSDGSSSLTLDASNTPSSGSVTLPGTITNVVPVPAPSAPTQIVVGPDQQLYFNTSGTSLMSVSPAGAPPSSSFVGYNLAVGSITPSTTGLTTGPDGAIWITDNDTPSIVRVSPTENTVFDYPLPGSANPMGIATGTNGYMFFTDNQNDIVYELSITGAMVPVNLTAGAEPQGIAAGPDGAAWAAESGLDKIVRVDNASLGIVETSVPGSPGFIAAGQDGNMWFTLQAAGKVGSISTDGNFTVNTYLAGVGTVPTAITSGPDNAMYFIESGTSEIGRIDLKTHAITTYALGGGANGPTGIVTGPDNNVWYTLQGSGQLIQMTP